MRVLGIDKLRAFAALSVVIAHIYGPALPGLWKYVFTGTPAVIGFFVISGFCIHRPYVNSPLNIKAFLAARCVRIMLPVFVAMYIAKLLSINEFNLVDGYILWSVTCELWYYAMYPLFSWASRFVSWKLQTAISFLISLGIVLYYGSDQYGNTTIYGWYLNWVVASPSWLLGCVIAEQKIGNPGWVLIWRIVTACLASVLFWLTLNTPVGFHLTLNPFSLVAGYWLKAEIASCKKENWLDWIGKWSFSIYLIHMLANRAIELYFHWIPYKALAIATLVMCYVFYLAVEKPSHLLARKIFKSLSPRENFPAVPAPMAIAKE
jgi:peptidoglycan/LPS O-acetylase OafA/YrhL